MYLLIWIRIGSTWYCTHRTCPILLCQCLRKVLHQSHADSAGRTRTMVQ